VQLSKNTIIGELLNYDNSVETVFAELDMPCLGCPSSGGETLEEACAIHGVELDVLLDRLRSYLGKPTE